MRNASDRAVQSGENGDPSTLPGLRQAEVQAPFRMTKVED
jgi:hypothetical protein